MYIGRNVGHKLFGLHVCSRAASRRRLRHLHAVLSQIYGRVSQTSLSRLWNSEHNETVFLPLLRNVLWIQKIRQRY